MEFLENDKQSQVEADLELLREIADNMDAIKENEDLMQIKLTQFAAVQRDRSVISKHIKNVFDEGELEEKSNVQKMHVANSDK